MRLVKMLVGDKTLGVAKTFAYPDGKHLGIYKIPTYELTVSGKLDDGSEKEEVFEVFRFGLQFKKGDGSPRVVGLADKQTHTIKAWLPNYSVHSARSVEKGAWQVYDNFLIHDGPDDPKSEVYASIGCIEICNGPSGFDQFNDLLISLSGAKGSDRGKKLVQIGASRNMSITYMAASRPAVAKW